MAIGLKKYPCWYNGKRMNRYAERLVLQQLNNWVEYTVPANALIMRIRNQDPANKLRMSFEEKNPTWMDVGGGEPTVKSAYGELSIFATFGFEYETNAVPFFLWLRATSNNQEVWIEFIVDDYEGS